MVHQFAAPEDIPFHQLIVVVIQASPPFYLEAGGVIVGNLPVDAPVGGQRLVAEVTGQGLDLPDDRIQIRFLYEVAVLALVELVVFHPAEKVYAAGAVIDIDRGIRIVEFLHPE